MRLRALVPVAALAILAVSAPLARAGEPTPLAAFIRETYTKHEHLVPMRDGTRLFTAVYVPKDAGPARRYPILMQRTPYSVGPYGIDAHPALVAVSPQAPNADWFAGDDFHHNGAFFLAAAFNFYSSFGRPRPEPTSKRPPRFDHGTVDGYRFFLDAGPLKNLGPHMKGIRPAVLTVGQKTAPYYRDEIELPFFRHHLKGAVDPKLAEATVFETGRNRWRSFDAWPPKEDAPVAYQLGAEGRLSTDAPKAGTAAVAEWVSDPAKPVPYPESIDIRMNADYMTADQRFAARRPDVAVWQTPPLEGDVTGAGPLEAGREPAAGAGRAVPRPFPQEPRGTGAVHAGEGGDGDLRDARRPAHVPARAPDHGPGAEQLVPARRPEPADVRECPRGDEERLPVRHVARPPGNRLPFARGPVVPSGREAVGHVA